MINLENDNIDAYSRANTTVSLQGDINSKYYWKCLQQAMLSQYKIHFVLYTVELTSLLLLQCYELVTISDVS